MHWAQIIIIQNNNNNKTPLIASIPGQSVPECQTILGSAAARDDAVVTVST